MDLVVKPEKIALILGGGGSRGSIHLGTLKVMGRHGIIPDLVSTVSVGALVGAAYVAGGCSPAFAEKTFYSFQHSSEIFERNNLYGIGRTMLAEVLELTERLPRVEKIIGKPALSGIYKMEPLINIVAKIDVERLMNAPQEFMALAVHDTSGEFTYFSAKDPDIAADFASVPKDELCAAVKAASTGKSYPDWLIYALQKYMKIPLSILGSCAIEGFFEPISIWHRGAWGEYHDPGLGRPLPILKAIRRGYNTIIVSRCHSDALREPAPKKILRRMLNAMTESSNQLEKEEIKNAATLMKALNFNFFVIEPRAKISPTFQSVGFKPGDHQKAVAHMEEVAHETLEPLIKYVRCNRNSGSASDQAIT